MSKKPWVLSKSAEEFLDEHLPELFEPPKDSKLMIKDGVIYWKKNKDDNNENT